MDPSLQRSLARHNGVKSATVPGLRQSLAYNGARSAVESGYSEIWPTMESSLQWRRVYTGV
eukprot:5645785-Lingulodinium_polyedra.AAC.1